MTITSAVAGPGVVSSAVPLTDTMAGTSRAGPVKMISPSVILCQSALSVVVSSAVLAARTVILLPLSAAALDSVVATVASITSP